MQEDGGQATPESYRAYVDQVVEITPDDRCVLWVMPFSKWYQERDALFREQITEGLQAQPCHATVPWHEAAGAAGAQLMRDGLHPNEAGKAWLADAIADTIDEAAADAES